MLRLTILIGLLSISIGAFPASTGTVPLIHCTDLLFPPDDPDDYFDLASVFAVPEYDLRYVILDQGEKQKERPGRIPVSQLNHITGRNVPVAVGLNQKLKSPDDKGLDQPAEYQQGVEAILRVLRETTTPVAITVVGSLRDIAAAYNREPELLKTRVSYVYVFSGEASDPKFIEWNVSMDPHAYVGFMRSETPICWIPCFDKGDFKNAGHGSYWVTTQSELLRNAPEPLLQYFVYGIHKMTSDPLRFVEQPIQPDHKAKLFETPRNMWGGALLAAMAGRVVVREGDDYVTRLRPGNPPHNCDIYGFREVEVGFTEAGSPLYPTNGRQATTVDETTQTASGKANASISRKMLQFEVRDPANYTQALTSATASLLSFKSVAGE